MVLWLEDETFAVTICKSSSELQDLLVKLLRLEKLMWERGEVKVEEVFDSAGLQSFGLLQ